MKTLRLAVMPLILAALAGCSSEPTGTAPDQLIAQVVSGFSPGSGESQVRDISELNRAAISGLTAPLLLVEMPQVEVATTVLQASVQGKHVTWGSADGGAVVLNSGVLFATRGVGWDLLSAETRPVEQHLAARRSGSYSRAYRHLDGLDRIVVTDVTCSLQNRGPVTIEVLERRHSTTRFDESCSGGGEQFVNSYWIGGDGTLWKSTQWVSPRVGQAVLQRLIR